MKYRLILIIFLVPFIGRSQETEKSFQLGFTLSPNLSWVTDDSENLISKGFGAGFSYGIMAEFGFAKNYFFSTAFAVTALTSKAEIKGTSTDKYKLQYIEIPLTLKLKSNSTNSGRFYGQFGLGTGINISAKKDAAYSDVKEKGIAISSDINTFRLGLIASTGAEWNIGRNLSAVTGVTFNNGFTKTFKDYASRNPYFTLNLGIFF